MKHYSTKRFFSVICFLFLIGISHSAKAGNTCGAPDAVTLGNCVTTSINGAGDAQSPDETLIACNGTAVTEEWFSISLTAGTTYAITYISSTNDNPAIDVYSGACGSLVYQTCANSTGAANPALEEIVFTPGATATYRIRVMNYLAGGGNISGRFCVYTKVTNDDPNTATAIVPTASCTYSAYTNAGATTSTCGTIPAPGCAGYQGGDVWFSVVVPASGQLSMEGDDNLVMQDGGMAVYTGTACGALTLVSCNSNSGPGDMPELNLSGLTAGSTIFIRFWEDGNNANGTFSLCVFDPCPGGVPANDNCENATVLSVFNAACSTTDGTIACATASPEANSCADTDDDDDVWYAFVAPTTSVNITITSVTGSVTDLYHVLYSGSCGSLTSVNCSDPNSSTPSGLTIGQTYRIRVYTTSATGGQTTTFKICVTEMSPCGNPTNNDYCSDPSQLILDPTSTFSASTANVYTADDPGSPSADDVFCSGIQNNSWFKFTATTTSHDFDIVSVTGCGNGIQAEVYEVAHDADGCCTAFTSVSNCYSPGNTTLATVTATGLTIGDEYLLMIDGYSGANCDYTIDGWSASSILPVELVDFYGKNIGNGNKLQWKTLSETNNSHFVIERSYDGENFGSIAVKPGTGNSNSPINYEFFDSNVSSDINVYYRLRQVDFDGHYVRSNIIVIYPQFGDQVVFSPNPAKDILTLELFAPSEDKYTVRTISINGSVSDQIISVVEGINTFSLTSISNLSSGIYLFQILDSNNQIIKSEKIIKD
jgi:hypothetical protein